MSDGTDVLSCFPSSQGRAVQTALSLDEGLGLCNNVFDPFDAGAVPDGQLVHMNGPISFPGTPIGDVEFRVTAEVARFKRDTEMYVCFLAWA